MGNFIGFMFLICLIGSIVGMVMLRRGETLRFETSSTPRQVSMLAVSIAGNKRKWTTLSQGDGSSNFSYSKRANLLVIILICLTIFGIPLAILYAIVFGKQEALSVNTDDDVPGMTSVQVQSNGFKGKMLGRSIRNNLALTPGAMAVTSGTDSQVATLTGGVVEARDAGAVGSPPEQATLSPEVQAESAQLEPRRQDKDLG